MATILGDPASAEVFVLALDGLLADQPSMEVREQRTQILAARFAPARGRKERAHLLTLPARILPDRILDRTFAAALRPCSPEESKEGTASGTA